MAKWGITLSEEITYQGVVEANSREEALEFASQFLTPADLIVVDVEAKYFEADKLDE